MYYKNLYLAGELFDAASRRHNIHLEKHLVAKGYNVILPQRTAQDFFKEGLFDLPGMVDDCRKTCMRKDVLFVGCADGTDADSGTTHEHGASITVNGRGIFYRTDFRTYMEKELGLNGMLTAKGTKIVYYPCYATEGDELEQYYKDLAQKIHEAVLELETTVHEYQVLIPLSNFKHNKDLHDEWHTHVDTLTGKTSSAINIDEYDDQMWMKIKCTEPQLDQIVDFTAKHYHSTSVFYMNDVIHQVRYSKDNYTRK